MIYKKFFKDTINDDLCEKYDQLDDAIKQYCDDIYEQSNNELYKKFDIYVSNIEKMLNEDIPDNIITQAEIDNKKLIDCIDKVEK
jgi:hypothetical protein